MTPTSTTEQEAAPIWRYVPLADYSLPSTPVTHRARKGLARIRTLLHRDEPESVPLFETNNELQTLPAWQLERIAPAPDWREAAHALNETLEAWQVHGDNQPVVVLISPPHNGHCATAEIWAEEQAWRVISPPTPEQILSGADGWLSEQRQERGPWVFPTLEKAFLRHATGLNVVRGFLDCAYAGELGRGIIGCDSWGWAFLRRVWHGRRPITLTLQAFDQERLAEQLQQLAAASSRRQLLFRQADNGRYVLPPPDENAAESETSNFLQHLAAHSRGIYGVAWAIWRSSLRAEPEETVEAEAEPEERTIPHETIWVTPWDQLKLPELPAGAGRDAAFLLHTLLLHNGLPTELLQQLVPLAPSQVMETLFWLEEAGLVAEANPNWQVTALGYPAARQFLQSNSYLVDQI